MATVERTWSEVPGLSDRHIAILDCAARVFGERGFGGTDVQVIADEAGVGKGTVYRHFGTKDELFLAAVDREIHMMSAGLVAMSDAQPTPMAALETAVRGYLEFFDERPWAAELMILERANFRDRRESTFIKYKERFRAYWEGLVVRLMESGAFREVSPKDTFELFSDALYGAMFTNHFAGHREPYGNKAETILDGLLRGMLLEPGEDRAGGLGVVTGGSWRARRTGEA